jgi:hypothetical protein
MRFEHLVVALGFELLQTQLVEVSHLERLQIAVELGH